MLRTALLCSVIALTACSKTPTEPVKKAETAKTPTAAPTSQPSASQPSASQPSASQPMKPPEGKPRVFFVWPPNGATVPRTFSVGFGLEGMKISPAGQGMNDKSMGHHHLIIDGGHIAYGSGVPMDEKHLHFGKGQTETQVTLSPGVHSLTMQFADGAHRSFGEALSASIKVTVAETEGTPKVEFLEPAEGATVKSPVKVKFGISGGMSVVPAGTAVNDLTKGHHHLIINGKPVALGQVVPADAKHIHFGKGQLETDLELPAGKHTLTLQFADAAHRSYGAALSQTINVTVE